MSAGAPASPCVALCALDPASGYCRGCWRSLAEIAAWPRMAVEDKRRVLAALPARRAAGAVTPGPAGA